MAADQNLEEGMDPLGMSLLTQALQPDKIFDLPLALVRVQRAFQQANQNAEMLKESLEMVLQREQTLIEQLNAQKREKDLTVDTLEEDNIRTKLQFKDQLVQYSASVSYLQQQLEDKDSLMREY